MLTVIENKCHRFSLIALVKDSFMEKRDCQQRTLLSKVGLLYYSRFSSFQYAYKILVVILNIEAKIRGKIRGYVAIM